MKGILVDSNIILDIVTNDPKWADWSSSTLSQYADQYILYINPIIYAEISVGYEKIEEVEAQLPNSLFKRAIVPWEAAFLAGKVFLQYRKNGGHKTQTLPDFFIAAHAVVENLFLMTRDSKRFNYYFPTLKLITPIH